MKLNYRDRMILAGLLAFIILLAGGLGLVKPKINDIKDDNKQLENVKDEWEQIETKIKEIKPLQDSINDSYEKSQKLVDDFVDPNLINETYELDRFMQEHIDACNLEIKVLDLEAINTSELEYYYFTPIVLTSSMLDAADVNGNYAEATDIIQAESNSLSARTAETVMLTRYGVTVEGTRDDLWKFMKTVKELDTAVIIESINIDDYRFGEDNPAKNGKSEITMIIDFYSVFEMDEPVVE